MKRILLPSIAVAYVGLVCGTGSYVPGVPPIPEPLGERLPIVFIVPFGALVLSIAILPWAAGNWWKSNANKAKLVGVLSLSLAGLLLFHFGRDAIEPLGENFLEYVSFITLLAALYVVAGGIVLEGKPASTPLHNVILLACGALLANLIGTTGASMVLVRPLLRANQHRRRVAHLPLFLIFIVANCGGLLTPLGDPPLYVGYLAGVPFTWTLRLWPQWGLMNGLLLAIFWTWDHVALRRDEREDERASLPAVGGTPWLRIRGLTNVAYLAGIVAVVFASGRGIGNAGYPWPFGVREGILGLLALASFFQTNRELHERNRFSLVPLVEVGVLFAGIFITITPILELLNANGGRLGWDRPWQYFWGSGLLSTVLDNAPTYLAVASSACGSHGVSLQGDYLGRFLELSGSGLSPVGSGAGAGAGAGEKILAAIACGCVFMGAGTYLGNGPNFMIKAIAEESNIRMPGFVGYLFYSVPILFPLFGLVTIVCFR